MTGLLLAMYPARWRRRYGEEFRAMLEMRPLGPFDVADILLGALDARLQARRFAAAPPNRGGQHTMLRIGGLGAIAGGALWVVGFAGGSINEGSGSLLWFVLMLVGSGAFLLALIGLSAFQARLAPRLAWAAFLVPALGSIVSIIGLVGMLARPSDFPMILGLGPWSIWMIGILGMVVGSILFAVATVQADVLSRHAAMALAASSSTFLFIALLGLGGGVAQLPDELILGVSVISFGSSWAWLGISALRRGPIRAVAPA